MIRDVEIKFLNETAKTPTYGTEFSAGLDLVACNPGTEDIAPLKSKLIPTGISINMMTIPEDCVALIFPRSGKGHKEGIVLGNSTGVIDQDYHGEIFVSVLNRNSDTYITIRPGDKIAQLVIVPIIRANFVQVEEFSTTTQRGSGGFGSTGN